MTELEIPQYILVLTPQEITAEIAVYEKALRKAVELRETYEGSQYLCVDGYSWYDDEYGENGAYNPVDDEIEECEEILTHLRQRVSGVAA